ncbi:MAG: DUF5658 family protein [Syntrophobacteraceae bacterium]|jgi:hypothetical protein
MENGKMNRYESNERRSGKDRRARPTSPFTLQSLVGSRHHYRRNQDARKFYFVDLYSPFSVVVLLSALVLSIADAFLTLMLVGEDIQELNPVMDFFLKIGPFQFIMIKWFLTAFGLITLLVLKNYYLWQGRVRTVVVLALLPFLYLALVSYEILMVVNG